MSDFKNVKIVNIIFVWEARNRDVWGSQIQHKASECKGCPV